MLTSVGHQLAHINCKTHHETYPRGSKHLLTMVTLCASCNMQLSQEIDAQFLLPHFGDPKGPISAPKRFWQGKLFKLLSTQSLNISSGVSEIVLIV